MYLLRHDRAVTRPDCNLIRLIFPKVLEHKLSHLIQCTPITVDRRCKTNVVRHLNFLDLSRDATRDSLRFDLIAVKTNMRIVTSTIRESFSLALMLYCSVL